MLILEEQKERRQGDWKSYNLKRENERLDSIHEREGVHLSTERVGQC